MLRINVVAHPGARTQRVELSDDGVLGVWVRARPIEGAANAAIESAIASALALRPRHARLVVGGTSRRKIVEVDLPDLATLRQRLLVREVRSD